MCTPSPDNFQHHAFFSQKCSKWGVAVGWSRTLSHALTLEIPKSYHGTDALALKGLFVSCVSEQFSLAPNKAV